MQFLAKLWKRLTEDDPVRHCEVYKRQGCSHVDGIDCDMKTCPLLKKYKELNEPCPHCGYNCTGKTAYCTKGVK